MLAARSCLVSLGISQLARSLADSCLRGFLLLQVLRLGQDPGGVQFLFLTLFLAPFVLLAPVNGALSNSLPKRWVLAGAAAFCWCMTALCAAAAATYSDLLPWWIGLGLLGTGHAVYRSAYYAMLPAAAEETRWPLNRVMGCMEMGDALAALAGFLLAWWLHDRSWSEAKTVFVSSMESWELPVVVAVALGFDLVAVLGALPVHFRADVRRPEPPGEALGRFFRDTEVIVKDRAARGSLLGLAYYLGLSAAGFGFDPLVQAGLAAGSLLAAIQGHPRRMLGLVPPAALGLVAVLLWAALGTSSPFDRIGLLLFGLMGGLIAVPLRTLYQFAVPAEMRGNGMAFMLAATSLAALAPTLFRISDIGFRMWLLVVLAAAGALVLCRVLLREAIEQLGEIVLWPMYRIRAHGPGRFQIPQRGALLVIANHTAWFDPLWLAKVLPRRLTPMMTSKFFDLPILHWLMRNVAGAIRVPFGAFRREAPELQEAVAVLDRGGCVLIFPEGSMKRQPEQSVRPFGQGVWRILRQRPETPVVACWIEGGWGSYTSYCGGLPAVNKPLDWWWPIEIALETPQRLDPALLADQHATRHYLMHACLEARRHLGLQPLPLQTEIPEQQEKNNSGGDEER